MVALPLLPVWAGCLFEDPGQVEETLLPERTARQAHCTGVQDFTDVTLAFTDVTLDFTDVTLACQGEQRLLPQRTGWLASLTSVKGRLASLASVHGWPASLTRVQGQFLGDHGLQGSDTALGLAFGGHPGLSLHCLNYSCEQ